MHNRIRVSGVAISAALALAIAVPMLSADSIGKKTAVTFGESVEIPGMVLHPGTYVFELERSQWDRDIVQVFDKDKAHLLTTFIAIPDYRLEPTNKTVIELQERAANAPQAIHSWFYAGESDGLQFIYPRSNQAAGVVAKPAVH
jgi:hypothetical protein